MSPVLSVNIGIKSKVIISIVESVLTVAPRLPFKYLPRLKFFPATSSLRYFAVASMTTKKKVF